MKKRPFIPAHELKRGYESTIENALRSFGAATVLLPEYPDKALALAQLGQEEVGKSLTLLAAFYLPPDEEAWQWFWKGWANHQLKAHRAYLYEIFSPTRIEFKISKDKIYAGEPLRHRISQEKESGLYVDFDLQTLKFSSPSQAVTSFEAMARTSTLAYLSATADAVQRTLLYKDFKFRIAVFSEVAYRICSEEVYQQDMPDILEEFGSRSDKHASLVADLEIAFAANTKFFKKSILSKDTSKPGDV